MICALLCVYFSYHTISGERGALKLMSAQKKIETLSKVASSATLQKDGFEARVVMMRGETLDKDLLEERVRYTLGYKYSNELSVLSN